MRPLGPEHLAVSAIGNVVVGLVTKKSLPLKQDPAATAPPASFCLLF